MTTTVVLVIAVSLTTAACLSSSPSVSRGRTLYEENGCATCHGASGRGDGPVGRTLSPPPRDFQDAASYTNGRSEEAIARTLADGINRNGAKMPAFAHLTEQERRSLALFVLCLGDRTSERTRP